MGEAEMYCQVRQVKRQYLLRLQWAVHTHCSFCFVLKRWCIYFHFALDIFSVI